MYSWMEEKVDKEDNVKNIKNKRILLETRSLMQSVLFCSSQPHIWQVPYKCRWGGFWIATEGSLSWAEPIQGACHHELLELFLHPDKQLYENVLSVKKREYHLRSLEAQSIKILSLEAREYAAQAPDPAGLN